MTIAGGVWKGSTGEVDGLRGESGTMELEKKVEALWEGVEALGRRDLNNHS